MSWIYLISPIFAIIAVFIAYMGGYKAGKKKALNEQFKAKEYERKYVDKIINNNNNLTDNDINSYFLSKHTNK